MYAHINELLQLLTEFEFDEEEDEFVVKPTDERIQAAAAKARKILAAQLTVPVGYVPAPARILGYQVINSSGALVGTEDDRWSEVDKWRDRWNKRDPDNAPHHVVGRFGAPL